MTLPSDGELTMAQIQAEYIFGNHKLGSYYGLSRGLPTSAPIKYSHFRSQNAFSVITVGGPWTEIIFDTYGYDVWREGSIDNGVHAGDGDSVTITAASWNTSNNVFLRLGSGTHSGASAFHTMYVGSTPFVRTAADGYTDFGTYSEYSWNETVNPFGTSGTAYVSLRMA